MPDMSSKGVKVVTFSVQRSIRVERDSEVHIGIRINSAESKSDRGDIIMKTAQMSSTTVVGAYPYGTSWHILPGFDLIWSF